MTTSLLGTDAARLALLEHAGIAPSRPGKARRAARPPEDVLELPRSFLTPLSPRQAVLWRALLEALADICRGTWAGPRGVTANKPRHGWPTLDAAMQAAFGDDDDAPDTGWLGLMLERARDQMGSGNPSGRNTVERRAFSGLARYVGKALVRAYQDEVHRHEVPEAKCRQMLIDSYVGIARRRKGRWSLQTVSTETLAEQHETDVHTVRAVLESGRRAMRVELAARGLLPAPRGDDPMLGEVERRERELLRSSPAEVASRHKRRRERERGQRLGRSVRGSKP